MDRTTKFRKIVNVHSVSLGTDVRRKTIVCIVLALLPCAAKADITSNLVGWWRLDEGLGSTTARDLSGKGKDGTLENGADPATAGQINRAVTFAGSGSGGDDQISLPTSLDINNKSAITIAAWVKPTALVDFQRVFSLRSNDSNRIEICSSGTGAGGNNDFQVILCNGSSPHGVYTTGDIISANVWHHWCMVFDGSAPSNKLKIYFDGVLQSVTTAGTIPSTTPSISGSTGYIGRRGSDGTLPFAGVIDDVRMYDRALTSVDVTELYNWRGLDGIVDNQFSFGSNPTNAASLSPRVLGVGKRQLLGIGIADSKIEMNGSAIAPETGAISGVAKEVVGALEVIITTPSTHSVNKHDYVQISGVGGYTDVNDYLGNKGNWVAEWIDGTHFRLKGSSGTTPGTYTMSTGTWTKASRFVTVENYGTGDAIPYARVAGLEITGTYGGNGQGESLVTAPEADGIHLSGISSTIENVKVRKCNGVCATSPGWLIVRNSFFENSFTGIQFRTSDCFAHGNTVAGMRDHGLHVMKDCGNCYTWGNHFFGVNNGEPMSFLGTRGEAALIQGEGYRSVNDVFADSYNGLVVDVNNAQITNGFFQHNPQFDVRFTGPGSELHGCVVFAMASTSEYPNKVSISLEAERCAVLDGTLELLNYAVGHTQSGAAIGIQVKGDKCTIRTRLVDEDTIDGTTAILIDGPRNGTRIDCRVHNFEGEHDRLLKATATMPACKDIQAEFHGNFADIDDPGTESSGLKKYLDLGAGWTGTIKFVNMSDGETVTITGTPGTPGSAY